MKDFIFSNPQKTFRLEFKTDHLDGLDNFTVQDIIFNSDTLTLDDLIRLGLDYRRLPYTLAAFKTKATDDNYTLEELDNVDNETTELKAATALDFTTAAIDAGTQGTAEATVVTIPATSGATQGDYFTMTNKAGVTFAIWLDIDSDGTVPSGDDFLATDYQIMVGIATGDTAAQAAAKVKTDVEADENWDGFDTITDNTDGTLTITASDLGDCTDATVSNAVEDGVGSISVSITDGTGDYSFQVEHEGGNGEITYELDSTSDALVDGLTLSEDGIISGVPTTTGTPDLVFKITDGLGQTAVSDALTLTIT